MCAFVSPLTALLKTPVIAVSQLIPLAITYFKRHAKGAPLESPERFIAIGHAESTAGYCLANQENGHFVTYIKNKRKRELQREQRKLWNDQ